ncbi:hypothetical protein BHM03_00025797 [Ensete ventricosum]|nr:hypothetical protein BHM03_00025797 [Ensete ventricosum]
MFRTEGPWARLRAHLEMFGTESPWARLRARLEMFRKLRALRNLLYGGEIFLRIDVDSMSQHDIIQHACTGAGNSVELGAWGRYEESPRLGGVLVVQGFLPHFVVEYLQNKTFVGGRASQRGWMSSASSHSESHSVAISTRRSRVLDHPSRDSRSIIALSSSEGAAPADSGAAEALAVMQSCFNVDSTITTRLLVEVTKHYYIPLEYELHVPLLGEHPHDAFSSGFSLSTDALEAGLRFSLHPVIEACLEGW